MSKWDICLFFELSELLSKNAYIFLPESLLQHHSYLRWCGAIPFNASTPRLAHAQIAKPTSCVRNRPSFGCFHNIVPILHTNRR